jgi:hypothetical protein
MSDLSSIDLESNPSHSILPLRAHPNPSPYPNIIQGILVGGTGWICFVREESRLVDTPLWYWSLCITLIYSCLILNGILSIYVTTCYPYWYRFTGGRLTSLSGAIVLYLTPNLDWYNLLVIWSAIVVGWNVCLIVYGWFN